MKQYEEIANMRNSNNEVTGYVMYDYDTEKFFCIDNEKLKQMCQQNLVRYLAYDSYANSLVPYYTNEEIADLGKNFEKIGTYKSMEEYFTNDYVIHERYKEYVGGTDFIIALPTVPIKTPAGIMVPFFLIGSQKQIDTFITDLPKLIQISCRKVRNFWAFTATLTVFESLRDLKLLNKVLFSTEFIGAEGTVSFSSLESKKVLKRSLFRKEPKQTDLAILRKFFADITEKNLSRVSSDGMNSMKLF